MGCSGFLLDSCFVTILILLAQQISKQGLAVTRGSFRDLSIKIKSGALNDHIFKLDSYIRIFLGNLFLCVQNIQNKCFYLKNVILVVQARNAEKAAASKNKISYQNKDFKKGNKIYVYLTV